MYKKYIILVLLLVSTQMGCRSLTGKTDVVAWSADGRHYITADGPELTAKVKTPEGAEYEINTKKESWFQQFVSLMMLDKINDD